MKKIAVTGGKGGTGKSTFSILLANKFRKKDKKVILVDCDVQCPNDYLLLGKKLTKERKKINKNFPKLIKEKCRKCGLCAKKCKVNAIFQAPGKYPKFIENLCTSCGLCWNICPYGAIEIEKKQIAGIYKNKVDKNFLLFTGKTKGINEKSGLIVSGLKKYINHIAKKFKPDIIIFDTAAGLHHGVIRAILDTDLIYAVTEPTPLGAHDLKLIIKLIKKLKIPYRVVLNQADLGDKSLIKQKVDIYIPHSKKIARAYARGRLHKHQPLGLKDQ